MQPDKWDLQNVLNLLWSMAVHQKIQHPAFISLVHLAAERLTPSRLSGGILLASGQEEDQERMGQMFQVGHDSKILLIRAWWYHSATFCVAACYHSLLP